MKLKHQSQRQPLHTVRKLRRPLGPIRGFTYGSFSVCLVIMFLCSSLCFSAEQKTVREIFVPETELGLLLNDCKDRILLPRAEFETLEKEARTIAEKKNAKKTKATGLEGTDFVLLSSDSKIRISGERALISTELEYEIFTNELIAIPIPLDNVVLRSAMCNGKPAPVDKGLWIANSEKQTTNHNPQSTIHKLRLEMVTSLKVDSTRQEIAARIPQGPISKLSLEAPGDVELLSGASVVRRLVDSGQWAVDSKKQKLTTDHSPLTTQFDLLPNSENLHLVLSLNSHKTREERTVLARSVQLNEITTFYNRIHATVSLSVLFQPIESFRFSVPEQFEITDVRCTQLNRWKMNDEKQLELEFHEPVSGQITVYISGEQESETPHSPLSTLHHLEPLEVATHSAVVGLLVDTDLELSELRTERLLPIDATVLRSAIPQSVFEVAPGSPAIRVVAAWYAPQGNWNIAAKFFHPPGELDVLTNLVLELREREPVLHGAFILTPLSEKVFSTTLSVPKGWQLVKLTDASDKALDWELVDSGQLLVDSKDRKLTTDNYQLTTKFPHGINPGSTFRILFELRGETVDWFGTWTKKELAFPKVSLIRAGSVSDRHNADRHQGTIAVNTEEDWTVTPKNVHRLILLNEAEKAKSLTGIASRLAFRFLNPPYDLDLVVEKKEPRIKATTYAFYRIEPSVLKAHYELNYFVEEAGTKTLAFLLPENSSETPEIRARESSGMGIKESSREKVEIDGKTYQRWTVQLTQPAKGHIWLSVDLVDSFQLTVDSKEEKLKTKNYQLPTIRAEGVAWQSGLVAIEGHEDLNIEILADQNTRSVDVGELAPAEYQPGARVLGAFREPQNQKPIRVSIQRNSTYALTPSIIQSVTSDIRIGADNKTLNHVQYDLKTKATYLKIDLSEQETLWSVFLDGELVKPQRIGEDLLLDIPSRDDSQVRKLKLLFSSQAMPLSVSKSGSAGFQPAMEHEKNAMQTSVQPHTGRQDACGPRAQACFRTLNTVRIPQLFVPAAEEVQEQTENWNEVPIVKYRYKIAPPPGFKIAELDGKSIAHRVPRPAVLDVGAGCLAFLKNLNPFNYIGCGKLADTRFEKPASFSEADSHKALLAARDPADISMEKNSYKLGKPIALEEKLAEAEDDADPFADDSKSDESSEKSMQVPTKAGKFPSQKKVFQSRVEDRAELRHEPRNPQISLGKRLESAQPVSIQLQEEIEKNANTVTKSGIGRTQTDSLAILMLNTKAMNLGEGVVWAVCLLLGFLCLRCSAGKKIALIFFLAILGTVLVFVPALANYTDMINAMVYAAFFGLIPLFLFVGLVRWCGWIYQWFCREIGNIYNWFEKGPKVSTPIFLAVCILGSGTLYAQETEEISVVLPKDAIIVPYDLSKIGEDEMPDPEKLWDKNQSILVPRELYQKLVDSGQWTVESGKQKLTTKLSFAGAKFQAKLDALTTVPEYGVDTADASRAKSSDSLLIEGKIRFELFTDEPTIIPLPISTSAIDSATLDGQPAQLSVDSSQLLVDSSQSQLPTTNYQLPTTNSTLLFAQGKGEHELAIKIRFTVQRQGGWRIVSGQLPNVSGTAVELIAKRPGMEIRLGNPLDQRKFESKTENEIFQTTLDSNGKFVWQWREKISEGEVDHSLTADSEAVFDIQEDGFQLIWNTTLALQKGRYESFRFRIPQGYTICAVEGRNVRGWAPIESEDENISLIDVELLKQADAQEKISFSLRKNETFEPGQAIQKNVPKLHVPEAVMHHGRITIRRSPFLDVKTTEIVTATQTDLPGELVVSRQLSVDSRNQKLTTDSSPLTTVSPFAIRPLSAFRFTSEAFQVGFSAVPVEGKYRTHISNVLKLSEFSYRLESQIVFSTEKRPLYHAKIRIPKNMSLEKVSMQVPFEWSKSVEEDGEQYLSLFLTDGLLGMTILSLEGALLEEESSSENLASLSEFTIPRLDVLDMENFETQFWVLLDPAFDVSAKDWKNLSPDSRQMPPPMPGLTSQKNFLNLLRLQFKQDNVTREYSGKLTLTPRSAEVFCDTITNVSVGSQSLEETTMLDFKIQRAGIRRIELILPHWMRDAKINVPMLQWKQVTPLDEKPDSPVHVKIDLQDDVMNELRILISNDRLLLPDTEYRVSVPVLLTGQANRQFIVFENRTGLDELNVDTTKLGDFRSLQREGSEWNYIAGILGNGVIQAYLVDSGQWIVDSKNQKLPTLPFKMRKRETIALSKASIGLAETRMMLGSSGEYIAEQIYRIDNKTEQFLDLLLPLDAQILTSVDSGGGVDSGQLSVDSKDRELTTNNSKLTTKPCTLSAAEIAQYRKDASKVKGIADAPDTAFVRIPLLKTEVGDLDRVLRIVYAGKVEPLASFQRMDFPFVKVLNIPVESSTVRLGLPADFQFYRFEGTLQLANQSAVRSQEEAYREKVIGKLQDVSGSTNVFENVRAMNSLGLLKSKKSSRGYDSSESAYGVYGAPGSPRSREIPQPPRKEGRDVGGRQGIVAQRGTSSLNSQLLSSPNIEVHNSARLQENFENQQNWKSKNIVAQMDSNVGSGGMGGMAGRSFAPSSVPSASKETQFQSGWLVQNDLVNPQTVENLGEHQTVRNSYQPQQVSKDQSGQRALYFAEQNQTNRLGRGGGRSQAENTQMDGEFAKKIVAQQAPQTAVPLEMNGYENEYLLKGKAGQSPNETAEVYRERLAQQNAEVDSRHDASRGRPTSVPQRARTTDVPPRLDVPPQPGLDSMLGEQTSPSFGGFTGSGGMGGGRGGMGGMSGGMGMGGMSGAAGSGSSQASNQYVAPSQDNVVVGMSSPDVFNANLDVPGISPIARNLTSLDVELPKLGEESIEYYFTTPQGEVELSAYTVSSDLVGQCKQLGKSSGVLVFLFALCWLSIYVMKKRFHGNRERNPLKSVL